MPQFAEPPGIDMQGRAARNQVGLGLRSQSIGFSADYDIQFKVVSINIVYQDYWMPIYFGRTKPKIAAISKGRNRPCEHPHRG
jgi:hypothetical protein